MGVSSHGLSLFNVSLSSTNEPGTRSEVKNLNSFRSVENAVAYEIERQTELLEKGQPVIQETRGWDEAKQKTTSQRGKEEAHDYRYMPEPDVPPVELSDEFVEKISQELPVLPPRIRKILNKLSIDAKVVEDILDRPPIVPVILEVMEKTRPADARRAAFWLIHAQPPTDEPEAGEAIELEFDAAKIIELSKMVDDGELSSTAARKVFEAMLRSAKTAREIAKEMNILQVSDEQEIEKIVKQVLADNPQAAEDVSKGEHKAIGFLVGQVMAKSRGQANPGLAQKIIKKLLGVSDG